MADDERERERRWAEDEPPPPPDDSAPHDDIMKRLLDYQRSLREGASPEEAAEAAAHSAAVETSRREEILDLSAGEAEAWPPEPPAPEPQTEAAAEHMAEVVGQGVEAIAEEQEPPIPLEEPPRGSAAEAPSGPAPDDAGTRELRERLAGLEARLDRLGAKLGELRQSFQDLAIAADERLAAIEDEIADARREGAAE